MPALFGAIIGARLATLHELQTHYSYEDALNLQEILMTQRYNEWVINNQQK